MPPAMPKDVLQDLYALAERHAAAAHGGKRALIEAFAHEKGLDANTVYGWLRTHAGFKSGRKTRTDCGATRLPDETLHFIAASVNESVRNNGISTKPICVAMNIAHQNGMAVNVTASRISALLRAQRLDVKAQANARNHQRMRSLHPNHVHQIDPSLCLVYYLNGKQYVMREQEFNKNKPCAIEKVKLKVWRYVRYDHASGCLDARYYEAAGENQRSLFEFLLYTFGRSDKRVSHGVPKMLLWDKGSANTSAANWVRDYNANVMPHIDSRIQRDDGKRHVRDDLWNLIAHTPEALVEMPEREVCAYFMRGKEETRQIRNGHITFVHPQSGKSELYSLQDWAKDFANDEKVRVSPMLLGDRVLRVEIDRYGQDPLHVEVSPESEFDTFGRPLSAVVLGEERRTAPHTAAQEAAKQIAQTAYGKGTSLKDADALRAKNARPFQHFNEGRGVVAHTHLGQAELPARLLPDGQEVKTIDMAAVRAAKAVRVLTLFEVARDLSAKGVAMTAEKNAQVRSWYPGGVPEDQLDDLLARLTVRAGLRMVAGGAA